MVRVAISVEGQTEEQFVKIVLYPHFERKNLYITPVNINGNINIQRVSDELGKLAYNFDRVTTLYDFYGFKGLMLHDTKETLEEQIKNKLQDSIRSKIYPYIQMHEFEAILFSCPSKLNDCLAGVNINISSWAEDVLKEHSDMPENINNSPQTAPSKRLEKHTNYKKTIDGPKIAKAIGLELLRQKCQGFNDWITMIEGWAV